MPAAERCDSSAFSLRLASSYGAPRLEAAATRALEIGARSYGSVKSILANNMDRQPAHQPKDTDPILHANLRDPRYFH